MHIFVEVHVSIRFAAHIRSTTRCTLDIYNKATSNQYSVLFFRQQIKIAHSAIWVYLTECSGIWINFTLY